MLGTLLKYEFKSIGRILLPLFGAWIIVAVMLGLSLRSDGISEQSGFMIVMSGVLYGFFTIAAVIITTIVLIQRFYKNLLGNDGYFMFTLPVSTGHHLANKIISATAWTFIGSVAAIITGLAIAVSIEGFASVFDEIKFLVGDIEIALERTPSAFLIIFEFVLVVILAMATIAAKVYAAISVGHQWNNHRVLGAIVAYIVISIIESSLINIGESICCRFFGAWFYSTSGVAQTHIILLAAIAICGVMLAIYWFISWKLLDKRLNLE